MIEQLHYATTPRYNFPQLIEDLHLPQRIVEFSLNSMQEAKGRCLQLYESEPSALLPEEPPHSNMLSLNGKSISTLLTPLKPICDGTPVIAIDSSSIKIGETETGILCAIRGAIVWTEDRRFRYLRLGPFPFHITEDNKREVLTLLSHYQSSSLNAIVSRLSEIPIYICGLLERWIQLNMCVSSTRSIILFDGSLTAGMSSTSTVTVSQLLKAARERLNNILAFSKVTTIRFLGWRITDLILRYPPPCLFEVDGLDFSESGPLRLLGSVYVAKLSGESCAFRLDIDRNIPHEYRIEAVQRLLGSDLIFQSYPETLRLAHIFSTFTANEVIGIQRFITQKYGLRVVTRPNVRRLLFGPFGTGFED